MHAEFRLPGVPKAAQDAASARRWLARVLRTIDMDNASRTALDGATGVLRALEQRELHHARHGEPAA